MNKIGLFFKNVWNKIKSPSGIYLVLFYVLFLVCVASTITLVALGLLAEIYSIILYVFSFALLVYFVYTIVYFAPKIKENIILKLKKYKFTNMMLESYGYRTIVFSVFSFIINLAYIVFMGVMSVLSKTAWYFLITLYYVALSLMKGNIFLTQKKDKNKEIIGGVKAYKFSGIMFIFLTFVLVGIVLMIYFMNRHFAYSGLLIYAVATFTFYKIIMSIYHSLKARGHDDLYIKNIRNINLVSALISIIILQVAMFESFANGANVGLANLLTGSAVCVVILVMGIYMICKACKLEKQKGFTKL